MNWYPVVQDIYLDERPVPRVCLIVVSCVVAYFISRFLPVPTLANIYRNVRVKLLGEIGGKLIVE